jgi:REP element-mobilizing transposase RayT
VTSRLGDSLPQELLRQWRSEKDAWMKQHPRRWDERTEREYYALFMERIDHWLDKGMGSCVLRDAANAAIVAGALHHFDGERHTLASFVVMPNHVHVLFRPKGNHKLRGILQSWKGFTTREINKRLGRRGALWQEDYWDRLVRSYAHFEYYFGYIKENPARAGLKPGEFIYFEKEVE